MSIDMKFNDFFRLKADELIEKVYKDCIKFRNDIIEYINKRLISGIGNTNLPDIKSNKKNISHFDKYILNFNDNEEK
jgi:hypothetical protein